MNTTTKNTKIQYGYDYDGTADHIPMLPNSVVITGRTKKEEAGMRKNVGDATIYFLPSDIENTLETITEFKSSKINELGIRRFFENNPDEAEIIQSLCPNTKVILVKPDALNYVVFTSEGTGLPIAHHLMLEGYNVLVGQAETFKELGIESTPDEDKKLKDSQVLFKDIIKKKYPALKLLSALEKIKDKDNYFVYCDLNSLYKYGERLLKAGFTKGIFPTKEDYDFEKGREQAMDFVEENYPDIKIIPFEKVKTVEEAKKLVEESEVPLVIQSEGDFVSTICPPDDLEINKTEILSALEKHASDYSKGEIILKEKLIQPIEITPQIVFWNGEPVFTDIDIETKNIGDGENNGNQVGCGTNLIIRTELEDKINKIAFPPIVYEMAKKHTGIFIWDISIYFTKKGMFFGEFCSNRFGYDAVLTEMCMSGGAGAYFEGIQSLKNPLQRAFGAATRVFNLKLQKEAEIAVNEDDNTWVYEAKLDKGRMVSLGVFWDLAVITGCGDTITDAVEQIYETLPTLSFKEKYTRTKDDFYKDYPTSIIHRFNTMNHINFDTPDFEYNEEESKDYTEKMEIEKQSMKTDYEKSLKDKDKEYQGNIKSIRDEIKSIINEH